MTFITRSIKNNQRGWVFIDSLIAVVITVTALVAVIALYNQITKTTVATRNYQHATLIAQQQLENFRQYDNTDIIKNLPADIAQPQAIIENGVEYTPQIQAAVSGEAIDSRIKPLQVTVSWSDNKNGPTRSITVVNYYYTN